MRVAVPMLQQQQLMYAAVASMLRKDMPNLSDDQVRGMLPLIYGANPGVSAISVTPDTGFF